MTILIVRSTKIVLLLMGGFMRKDIHNVLRFSQDFLSKVIDLNNCPHGGCYNKRDHRCIECVQSLECEWLRYDVSSLKLTKKPLPFLIQHLELAICHVDSKLAMQGHDLPVCHCEACDWLRKAENLFLQAAEYIPRH